MEVDLTEVADSSPADINLMNVTDYGSRIPDSDDDEQEPTRTNKNRSPSTGAIFLMQQKPHVSWAQLPKIFGTMPRRR